MKDNHKILLTKFLIHCLALIPFIQTYYLAITDLSITDPVEMVIHFTGEGAIQLLIYTLCIAPAAKKFKLSWLMQTRRLIGLYVFFYALAHILSFWWFELNMQVSLFIQELLERPYIWVGLGAFIILTALAVTSPNSIRAKMGRKWQSLHNWVYLSLVLAWVHFYWAVKATPSEPLAFLAGVIFVFAIRWPMLKKWLKGLRKF
ncbi:sulfoxide reductase heme-binding subunit YedZ [Saccharobesus litoralis]|uniref:Protein-methionine-sulfoxide reductase heme-binding subunit MsrQ n=1 Tax=Saccharobesus litoralis TaxID=2172099 RepID=A0A2S0VVQ8_9ALTE|nr:protein-methionine-sulfoxide reductase heme-binding subunit MsrQ [Saccharobesus litoralis]AWB68190.1 sulfoxide reductase heme-binding subunit YedZ [Saccharobesus litoralis]